MTQLIRIFLVLNFTQIKKTPSFSPSPHMHQTGAQPNLAGAVTRHTSAKNGRVRVRVSGDESADPGQKFFDAYSNGMIGTPTGEHHRS